MSSEDDQDIHRPTLVELAFIVGTIIIPALGWIVADYLGASFPLRVLVAVCCLPLGWIGGPVVLVMMVGVLGWLDKVIASRK